jgi:NDP-sugar pyrophosphorylase family protein
MKAGIIAAGKGERLARADIGIPKPLVCVCGEYLIDRIIRAAASVKVSSIACIVNDLYPEVAKHLRSRSWPVPMELVVKTTPSSMESLFELSYLLGDEPFLLFTVDAVFEFKTLEAFVAEAQAIKEAHGVLALSEFVDDEKPLWVRVSPTNKIVTLGDPAKPSRFVTAGFYYFKSDIFAMIGVARKRKLNALRQFLGFLMESGYSLYGSPVSKTVDVDYPEDIEKAEAFLKEAEDKCNT